MSRTKIGIDYTAAIRQGGGIGRYTRDLVGSLLRLETPHQYRVFAATGGLDSVDRNAKIERLHAFGADVEFHSLPLSDDWMHRLWQRLRLPIPVEVVTGSVDVFYSPDFVLPPTLRSTRTLLTVHDLSFLHYPDAFVPALCEYLKRVVPRSVNRADRVLADSVCTRDDLVVHFGVPKEKVEVLYSGVDVRFRPEPEIEERERVQSRYNIGDGPYVLSIGTVQPRKNYVRLIRAFADLALANTQLLIGGGRGWLYEDVEVEAQKHMDRVRILGFVDDADLPALYRSAALFVFPSLYEGFGLPVLEAMACGVPVVCSDASSLPEVAGDAALMVAPHDAAALSEAMARVLEDNKLRQSMIDKGLVQAAQFTWDRAAEQLLDVFDRVRS